MKKETFIVTILSLFGYMMYSVDRMVLSSSISLISSEFGFQTSVAGVMLSSFFYGFIAFLFVGGILADRYSGKRILIIGVASFSFATAATGLATGVGTLLVYRILTGIGEGVFWPAAAVEVARVTTEKQRATFMSLNWCGFPLGGFLGTWLGANLGPIYGWRTVFYVAGFVGLIVATLYQIYVKTEKSPQSKSAAGGEKIAIREIVLNRSVVVVAIYYLALMSGWWIVLLWAPTFLMSAKHMTLSVAGTIASYLGLSGAVGGILMGRYCDAGQLVRRKTVLIGITLISGVLMASLTMDMSQWLTTVIIFLLGFFGFPITPVSIALTSQLVPKRMAGSAVGFVMNVGMIGGAIAPAAAGVLAGTYGMVNVWLMAAGVIFVSSFLLFMTGRISKQDAVNSVRLQ